MREINQQWRLLERQEENQREQSSKTRESVKDRQVSEEQNPEVRTEESPGRLLVTSGRAFSQVDGARLEKFEE